MTDQKDYTQEPGDGHLPDLHPYDYTRDERVLAACGWKFQPLRAFVDKGVSDVGPVSQGPYWFSDSGKRSDITPILTLSELWEGLCRECEGTGYFPGLNRYEVSFVWQEGLSHFTHSKYFPLTVYGSFVEAAAAALHWVLQQKEE